MASSLVSQATAAWRALAPLIAGRPVVRESLNGGRAYPVRGQRALTERLPHVPAAVPVYSAAGDTRVLVLDLDTSMADRTAVLRDAAAIRSLSTGIARSTVYQALETLAAFNLVEQRGGRWEIVAATSLAVLAETLGCAADMADRLAAHRVERIAYRRVLHIIDWHLDAMADQDLLIRPGSDGETALELLEKILGARKVA